MNVRISMGVYDGMWKIERKAGEGWTAHPAGVGHGGVMAYHASHAGTHHDAMKESMHWLAKLMQVLV